jgi:DNA-binding XRE family transcriptional regulator
VLAVREAIEAGYSWAQVAEQLGVSRQSAHERYAPRILALAQGAADRA